MKSRIGSEPVVPRVTFGLIVLNGEPFLRYNLRALYPFAHQIIVAEGACLAAAGVATPDGHSRDGTLETLRRFQREEDPEGKVTLVTAEDEGHPNGFWPGEKDEQSQAYAKRATGDYLWQVDSDEFYREADMRRVIARLAADASLTAVTFKMLTFWGSLEVITDGWYLRRGAALYRRLFRWGPGYRYATHRPPTVYDERGRDVNEVKALAGEALAREGICLYHYSLLFPKQVMEKCEYYGKAEWAARSGAGRWAQDNYLRLSNPFRVHNVYEFPSWLQPFRGRHPRQVVRMWDDIEAGRLRVERRPMEDVRRLLRSPRYRARRTWLMMRVWFELRRGRSLGSPGGGGERS